jgi:thiol-disulfide isomerase/thioredoxin
MKGFMLMHSHADWCGACRVTKPHFYKFAEWAKTHKPELRTTGINYADSAVLMSRFGISQLPTILLVVNGEVRDVSQMRERLESVFENDAWRTIPVGSKWFGPFSAFGNGMSLLARFGLFLVVGHLGVLTCSRSL